MHKRNEYGEDIMRKKDYCVNLRTNPLVPYRVLYFTDVSSYSFQNRACLFSWPIVHISEVRSWYYLVFYFYILCKNTSFWSLLSHTKSCILHNISHRTLLLYEQLLKLFHEKKNSCHVLTNCCIKGIPFVRKTCLKVFNISIQFYT